MQSSWLFFDESWVSLQELGSAERIKRCYLCFYLFNRENSISTLNTVNLVLFFANVGQKKRHPSDFVFVSFSSGGRALGMMICIAFKLVVPLTLGMNQVTKANSQPIFKKTANHGGGE